MSNQLDLQGGFPMGIRGCEQPAGLTGRIEHHLNEVSWTHRGDFCLSIPSSKLLGSGERGPSWTHREDFAQNYLAAGKEGPAGLTGGFRSKLVASGERGPSWTHREDFAQN